MSKITSIALRMHIASKIMGTHLVSTDRFIAGAICWMVDEGGVPIIIRDNNGEWRIDIFDKDFRGKSLSDALAEVIVTTGEERRDVKHIQSNTRDDYGTGVE